MSRRWQAKALQFADQGEEGAVAAMMSLLMGMRASEIVSRIVRDLDDEGRLLWIPETKTEAGKRTLPVPEVLNRTCRRSPKGRGPRIRSSGSTGGTGHGNGCSESAKRRRCQR